MALIKADEKYCFLNNPFSFLATRKVKHQIPHIQEGQIVHEVQRNLSLLNNALAAPVRPNLFPGDDDFKFIEKYQSNTPYFVIAPSSIWETKQWPAEKWKALMFRLPQQFTVYLIGSEKEFSYAQYLLEWHPLAENLCGKLSLLQSAALMKNALRVFSNDSAAMHLASGVNSPLTVIYCSTIPEFGFGPLSDDYKIIQTDTPLACRPCGLHGHKSCPEKHFSCAFHINPLRVYNALDFMNDTAGRYSITDYYNEALSCLQSDGILLMDTDTIPGLACAAMSSDAVQKLVQIKNRKPEKGFIVLCSNVKMIQKFTQQIPELAFKVWDLSKGNAISIIFTASRYLTNNITGPGGSIAIRIPTSELIQNLIENLGCPLISTSANISNNATPQTMAAVDEIIKHQVDFILEDKTSMHANQASPIISMENQQIKIIRDGNMSDQLRQFINNQLLG